VSADPAATCAGSAHHVATADAIAASSGAGGRGWWSLPSWSIPVPGGASSQSPSVGWLRETASRRVLRMGEEEAARQRLGEE